MSDLNIKLSPILHPSLGLWMLGKIEGHLAEPLTREEIEAHLARFGQLERELSETKHRLHIEKVSVEELQRVIGELSKERDRLENEKRFHRNEARMLKKCADRDYERWKEADQKSVFLEMELKEVKARVRQLIAERDSARMIAERKHVLRDDFAAELGVENGAEDCVEKGLESVLKLKRLLTQTTTRLAHASDIVSTNLMDCKMLTANWNRVCTEATQTLAAYDAAKKEEGK